MPAGSAPRQGNCVMHRHEASRRSLIAGWGTEILQVHCVQDDTVTV
jgi:hypothetical protein